MCRRTFLLISLVLGLACSASADLILHWTLDETSGAVANDSSGNGRNGTVDGTPDWVAGQVRGALDMDGSSDGITLEETIVEGTCTVAIWMMPRNLPYGSDYRSIFHDRAWNTGSVHGHLRANTSLINFDTNGGGGVTATTVCVSDEWYHALASFDLSTSEVNLYVNGVLEATGTGLTSSVYIGPLTFGAWNSNRYFDGIFDDIRIYDHAVTAEEVPGIMAGSAQELAADPSPADEQIDVWRDSVLEWGSGKYANTHNVYFGTVFDDVNNASTANGLGVLVSEGQSENTFDAGILDFDQTYYWRVDEVNSAPDRTVFKGAVWSFTAEPFSIPVETITATASSSHSADMGPGNTIGGVGLNELDQHSTDGTTMWLSGMGDAAPSIQYEFDKAYKLDEMLVWNSNQLIEAFVGIGAKDVVVEYSLDGVEWTVLEGATEFAQATGSPTYTANTMVDFGGALAQFVKITVNAGYGMLPQYGISEVRFLYIPTFPREPMPAVGDATAGANVELSWRAGREAASHQVNLGTDAADLPLVATTSDNSYAANGLAYETTYYWQVTEINENETPSAYAGEVWSFTTPTHGVVDNFDQYDDDCNRIFFAWADGIGHSGGEDIEGCDVAPSNGNGGGSIVGNDIAPFAEKTIVSGGSQSLPFNYDNTFGQSEATLSLDGQDWTASGVQSLSLMFYGTAGNTGTLYVKINSTKVAYADDAANIARAEWQAWVIDLSAVGGNLQNVMSLTIGVDGGNAAGMLYIDEIGLYPKAAEYLTPVDPGAASLAGHWDFNAGAGDVAADVSGNGNDGTLVSAGWDNGQIGSAVVFDGMSSYVDIPAAAWNTIEQQVTVAAWLYVDSSISQNPFTMAAFQDPGNGQTRVFSNHVLWGGTLYLDTGGEPGGYDRISKPASAGDYGDAWIHWAFTKNAETGEQKIYRNGVLWHSGTDLTRTMTGVTVFILGANAATTGEFWNGSMDDLRLYNQELSQEEILWLAGRTSPVVKPF